MAHNIQRDGIGPAANAVRNLYQVMRRDIEEPDGSWNGVDVVVALCEWFTRHGFDVEGPNPWGLGNESDDDTE